MIYKTVVRDNRTCKKCGKPISGKAILSLSWVDNNLDDDVYHEDCYNFLDDTKIKVKKGLNKIKNML